MICGEVSVKGWEQNKVGIKGLLDEELEEFIFDIDGSETEIKVRIPRNNSSWYNRKETDLVIHVPENSKLEISGVSLEVNAEGTRNGVEVGVVSGDVSLEGGNDRIVLQTVSGDIEIVYTDFIEVSGHSVSGDVEIRGQMKTGGVVEFDNVSGSIRLGLQGDINARFDIETGSGSIRNRLSDDKAKASKYVRDESLRFVLGDGLGDVVLSTRSGDITISDR